MMKQLQKPFSSYLLACFTAVSNSSVGPTIGLIREGLLNGLGATGRYQRKVGRARRSPCSIRCRSITTLRGTPPVVKPLLLYPYYYTLKSAPLNLHP